MFINRERSYSTVDGYDYVTKDGLTKNVNQLIMCTTMSTNIRKKGSTELVQQGEAFRCIETHRLIIAVVPLSLTLCALRKYSKCEFDSYLPLLVVLITVFYFVTINMLLVCCFASFLYATITIDGNTKY